MDEAESYLLKIRPRVFGLVFLLSFAGIEFSVDAQNLTSETPKIEIGPLLEKNTNGVEQISTNEIPYFMRNKNGLPELVLRDKRENNYFTGIPLIGFDPEQGFNYGLAIQRYENGPKDSPFFTHSSYRRKITIAAANSTGGSSSAILSYDQPYVNDTPWRIRSYVAWIKSERENYFGNDDRSLGALNYPGSPQTFSKINDYQNSQERVIDGSTYSHYNLYFRQDIVAAFNLEYDLMGGILRPLIGIQIDYSDIDDYTGKEFNGGINEPTLLATDQQQGRIEGFEGGWNNLMRVGLTFDTRDYEPNPTRGVVGQLLAQGGVGAFGSDFNYGQVTLNVMGFYPIMPDKTRLVFAGQFGYNVKFGDTPFFAQPNLALPNDEARQGLGGFKTLRGNVSNRFTSDVFMHANAELRWTFGDYTIFKQNITMMFVPFVDTGRVFDDFRETSLQDWKVGTGAGIRLAWNVATLISFDFGVSSEGSLFWMEIGHQF